MLFHLTAGDIASEPAAAMTCSPSGRHQTFGGVVALDGVDLTRRRAACWAARCQRLGQVHALAHHRRRSAAGRGPHVAGGVPSTYSPHAAGRRHRDRASASEHGARHAGLGKRVSGAERARWGGFVDRRAARAQARAVLGDLGAPFDVEQSAGMLTAAGQQFVEIARPHSTSKAADPGRTPPLPLAATEVARLFSTVRRLTGGGARIIFISHRLQEVEAICDSIMVLRNGGRAGTMQINGALDKQCILELMTGDPRGGVADIRGAQHRRDRAGARRRVLWHRGARRRSGNPPWRDRRPRRIAGAGPGGTAGDDGRLPPPSTAGRCCTGATTCARACRAT